MIIYRVEYSYCDEYSEISSKFFFDFDKSFLYAESFVQKLSNENDEGQKVEPQFNSLNKSRLVHWEVVDKQVDIWECEVEE